MLLTPPRCTGTECYQGLMLGRTRLLQRTKKLRFLAAEQRTRCKLCCLGHECGSWERREGDRWQPSDRHYHGEYFRSARRATTCDARILVVLMPTALRPSNFLALLSKARSLLCRGHLHSGLSNRLPIPWGTFLWGVQELSGRGLPRKGNLRSNSRIGVPEASR